MPIIEPAIRPPSEADSFLLQVTTGCSSNSCTFCGAYLQKMFRIKPKQEIDADIDWEKNYSPNTRRIFLMDGDALAIDNKQLLPILNQLDDAFPKLNRISSYVNGYNITKRSDEELQQLAEHKLTLTYMGLESGSQEVLDRCRKRASVEEMVLAVNRMEQAGIKTSVIVLLGLGGKAHSIEHVKGTIEALNAMQPRYLSFLTLMTVPGTALYQDVRERRFVELDAKEYLTEAKAILNGIDLHRTLFMCNHASNYFNLEGRLPKDKGRLLIELEAAIRGEFALKPESLRGL